MGGNAAREQSSVGGSERRRRHCSVWGSLQSQLPAGPQNQFTPIHLGHLCHVCGLQFCATTVWTPRGHPPNEWCCPVLGANIAPTTSPSNQRIACCPPNKRGLETPSGGGLSRGQRRTRAELHESVVRGAAHGACACVLRVERPAAASGLAAQCAPCRGYVGYFEISTS